MSEASDPRFGGVPGAGMGYASGRQPEPESLRNRLVPPSVRFKVGSRVSFLHLDRQLTGTVEWNSRHRGEVEVRGDNGCLYYLKTEQLSRVD